MGILTSNLRRPLSKNDPSHTGLDESHAGSAAYPLSGVNWEHPGKLDMTGMVSAPL